MSRSIQPIRLDMEAAQLAVELLAEPGEHIPPQGPMLPLHILMHQADHQAPVLPP